MTKSKLSINTTILTVMCLLLGGSLSYADSTSPRLAAYYDRKMLLCDQTAYQWSGDDDPRPVAKDVIQVGVGSDTSYVLTKAGRLLTWGDDLDETQEIFDQVIWFAAGRSGVFAARSDGAFVYTARPKSWFGEGDLVQPEKVGASIVTASIGDSADYFVTSDGTLFVKGLAHRGQYGDGKLEPSDTFIPVASEVVAIKTHTGHAILLKKDGTVMGTGGNIYGPLGRHGIGDKAVSWAPIFHEADAIATGSSHSLAVRRDGTLWHWGRDIGLDPKQVLEDVVAGAADQNGSVALLKDGSLWQWRRGQQPKKHFQCP
jgi:alpha-tubulin suppressor-like RCC1 family protein